MKNNASTILLTLSECKSVLLVLAGILLITSFTSSCENPVSMRNQEASAMRPSPTVSPEGKQYQRNLEYHYNEALKMRAAGKTAEAIDEFKKSIEAGTDDKETYREVARLLVSLKRYEEAEEYLRKVFEKDPEDGRAHWALARVLVEHLGKYEEGLKEALLSKRLYGDDGTSHVHDRIIGKAYDGLKDYENAIKHYKIFLKGSSRIPDSEDYKEIQKRLSELEKSIHN